MALVLADRVRETTDTSGTGAVTLDGAVTSYQVLVMAIRLTTQLQRRYSTSGKSELVRTR